MAGRPRKDIERIELRLPSPLAAKLRQEAEERGVSLQRHVEDLLAARDLLLTGRIVLGSQLPAPEPPAPDESDPMVDQWM